MKNDDEKTQAGSDCQQRLVRLDDVLRIVSDHPEYPEPCPMLHEYAAKAAAEMDKDWVMHMVRESCRHTKEAILADLQQFLSNADAPARMTVGTVDSHAATVDVIREIRVSDCGAWMVDRPDSRQKRIELMKLLDRLYNAAGVLS